MRKADVQMGATYAAKVSGRVVPVTIAGHNPYGGWNAVNETTGRRVHVRSAQRLRFEVRSVDGKWVRA